MLPLALTIFAQHARSRCRNFKHDLVGFNFDQDLVGLNHFARLFFPLQGEKLSSEMDSESWGTRTSVIAMIIFSVFKIWGALFGQHEAFAYAESLLQQRLVLFLVFGQVTDCRRGGSGTPA